MKKYKNQSKIIYIFLYLLIAAFVITGNSFSQADGQRIKAIHILDITGEDSRRLYRPARVFVSGNYNNDVYVIQKGYIYIFTNKGLLLSDIKTTNKTPAGESVVNSRGLIYIIRITPPLIRIFNPWGTYKGNMNIRGLEKLSLPGDYHTGKGITPSRLSIDRNDNLYILDSATGFYFVTNPDGEIILYAGGYGKEKGKFIKPVDIAVSFDGKRIAVADFYAGRINLFNNKGQFIRSIGSPGGSRGEFSQLVSVAIDSKYNIYGLDRNRHSVLIFSEKGEFMGEFGGLGTGKGWFRYPNDIYIDSKDMIYIADTLNNRIQVLKVKIGK